MVTPYMVDETYDTKLFTPIAQVGSKQVRTTIPAEYTEESLFTSLSSKYLTTYTYKIS